MKPTASFIREKITQDAWKVFLHFQVKIRHIIGQTFFTWMYFPTCCCTEQGATCANRKMRPDDLLMHRLYKVGLRLKASESSQCCEGPAVNSAKRKKRPVVPCHLQEKKGSGLVVVHNGSSHWLYWDLYNDAVPAPIHGPKIRLCITRKHVAACFCGIWDLCKKGLGLEVLESSPCYEYLLSSPVPSNF